MEETKEKDKKAKFELKKWDAVALWAWGEFMLETKVCFIIKYFLS